MVHNERSSVNDGTLRFTKMHGAGNDFVLADGQDLSLEERSRWSAGLCRRRYSVGADGLILVTRSDSATVDVDFYNPDGSRAEMCGNGSRCAARFAVEALGVDPSMVMHTISGTLNAEYSCPDRIAVKMPAPTRFQPVHAIFEGHELHHVTVGVPHTVIFESTRDLWDDERLREVGSRLRFDSNLYPSGTNVNVAHTIDANAMRVRTYERGVEDITLACGTGNTATAFVAAELGLGTFPFTMTVDGGVLCIEKQGDDYWLVGPARVVASGETTREALLAD